ncbi:MAG: ribosomal protein S18-alanine N-acetyltransferase [Candidatus Izemoplasmatales bacterium]|jgi:ribosomal-protein-alanine N-acetyltransferase|nr:ribosomal protein S18-alanine N-acetyltransferase [Candidatus Izemoplasmatales bacterium]
MKLKIRELQENEIDLIVDCENEYFHNFTTKSKIIEDLTNPLSYYYVLVSDRFLGYIILWIDEEKAQISSFVVKKEFRNKGYGFKFINFIFEKLKSLGIREVTLEVRPSNKEALSLYQKVGFEQVAIRRTYYNNGEDAFLMYKRLGSD